MSQLTVSHLFDCRIYESHHNTSGRLTHQLDVQVAVDEQVDVDDALSVAPSSHHERTYTVGTIITGDDPNSIPTEDELVYCCLH